MNWVAIGAIGEIVGAIAVVISLIYLSNQIRQGTKTAEDAAFRDVFASVGELFSWMCNTENRPILMKGLLDYHRLEGEEKFSFDTMLTMLTTLVESSAISNSADLVKDETMENWRLYLQTRYFAYPGAREWWSESKEIYILEVQDWYDKMIASADTESDYWNIKSPPNKCSSSDLI